MYYILKDKQSIQVSFEEYMSFRTDFSKSIVKKTKIGNSVTVSTVFLGIDHSFGSNTPVLFETMVFGGNFDEYQNRYHSFDEALEGHEKALNMVLEGNDIDIE